MPADLDIPEYAVSPHVAPIVALALIVVLDLLVPVPFLPRVVSLAVGIPVLMLGLGLWAWGVSGLLRPGESPNPAKATAQLVTSGPFRFSRNPIYTGGTIGLLGLALLLNTATGTAVVVVLAFLVHNLALAEERYLEAKFGDQWREYRSRVRRWI
ncbi:MAG: isoprenylcysteine carboxylmethyltransferase family protein [Arenicellales bacterium]